MLDQIELQESQAVHPAVPRKHCQIKVCVFQFRKWSQNNGSQPWKIRENNVLSFVLEGKQEKQAELKTEFTEKEPNSLDDETMTEMFFGE